jgi:hypothetical protein
LQTSSRAGSIFVIFITNDLLDICYIYNKHPPIWPFVFRINADIKDICYIYNKRASSLFKFLAFAIEDFQVCGC